MTAADYWCVRHRAFTDLLDSTRVRRAGADERLGVSIGETAPGIPPDVFSKIFDLVFSTTKSFGVVFSTTKSFGVDLGLPGSRPPRGNSG